LLAADHRQTAAESRERFGQIMEAITHLVHVAEIHESRPNRLDGGQ
jgi:hypothetical protein